MKNPAVSAPSPYPCNITLVATEGNTSRTALPTDVSLSVSIIGRDLYGGYDQADDYLIQIPATANDNTLTFSLSPYGPMGFEFTGLSPDGFTVYSGFNETFEMSITFNISEAFNLAVKLVPAT